jgi:hypothetical protein
MTQESVWTPINIRWDFLSNVYAQVPGDPEVIAKWIDARKPRVRPPGGKSIDEINEEVLASLAEGEPEPDYQMLVFQYTDFEGQRVIALRQETIRAHLKECASVLSAQFIGKVEKERSFAVKFKNAVYLDPRQRWLLPRREDGSLVTKPDGEIDRMVHTWRGNALKRIQYLEPSLWIRFRLLLLGQSITLKDLGRVLDYGGVHGYGGERSLDGGKYFATIEKEDDHG